MADKKIPSRDGDKLNRSAAPGGAQGPNTTIVGDAVFNQADAEGNPRIGGSIAPNTPAAGAPSAYDELRFRCADAGNADCRWEIHGRTAEEMIPRVEDHHRAFHDVREMDPAFRSRILDAIRERKAA